MKKWIVILAIFAMVVTPLQAYAAPSYSYSMAASVDWREEAAKWLLFKLIDKCVDGHDDGWVARTCRTTVMRIVRGYVGSIIELTDASFCTRAWIRMFQEDASHDSKMAWARCILNKGLPSVYH